MNVTSKVQFGDIKITRQISGLPAGKLINEYERSAGIPRCMDLKMSCCDERSGGNPASGCDIL
jgi:hypothetical protein